MLTSGEECLIYIFRYFPFYPSISLEVDHQSPLLLAPRLTNFTGWANRPSGNENSNNL